jgi:hypothetical protein
MSERLQGVDVFAALTLDWRLTADRTDNRQGAARWAEKSPSFSSYSSPQELVAAINQAGHADRSCRLLSELLAIYVGDDLAARAVLQAVIPGLRRAVRRRWVKARPAGPWQTERDLSADAASAAWDAIRRYAGRRHHRPAAVIVRHVEETLRRAHAHWISEAAASVPLTPGITEPALVEAGLSIEQQAATLIVKATGAGVIDNTDAALLLLVGVAGHTDTAAGSAVGVPAGKAARRLRRVRAAIRYRAVLDQWPPSKLALTSHEQVSVCPVRDGSQSRRGHP